MNTEATPTAVGSNAELGLGPEREHLRAAQAAAVMPLIGPLLDAWECCSQSVREEQPELDKHLRRINRAMEDAEASNAELGLKRAAFEAWLNTGNHPGNVSPWVEPGRYEKDTHQLAWLAWQRWGNALRQPGICWRGQDAGITAALTTLRANLKTPNA